MADDSDILMMFEVGGQVLAGESTTEIKANGRTGTQMLTGFRRNHMFEIESFGFGVGDESQTDDKPKKDEKGKLIPRIHIPAPTMGGPSKVTVQPVTFSRTMDNASRELLHHFIRRTNFDRAALVKRKAAGGVAAGEPYLRFDFKGVLLTGATWTNDEPVKENYTFYARAITMRYRPQLPDGTLGAIIAGFWSMAPGEKIEPL